MLKLTLNQIGVGCKVELNGQDISKFLTGAVVVANVGDLTTATLTYTGAVVIEGEPGQLTLRQAEHYVTCDECRKAVLGEKQDDKVQLTDVTPIGAKVREYVAPTAAQRS